jgi:hypothetical protein
MFIFYENRVADGKRCFQTGKAGAACRLVFGRVGRVVCGNDIYSAVPDCLDKGTAVVLAAEGRIYQSPQEGSFQTA